MVAYRLTQLELALYSKPKVFGPPGRAPRAQQQHLVSTCLSETQGTLSLVNKCKAYMLPIIQVHSFVYICCFLGRNSICFANIVMFSQG